MLLLLLNSNESGQDNPFRPDGDLSREADELVELLKGGRPISEVLKPKGEAPSSASPSAKEPVAEEQPFLAASPDRNSLASPTKNSPDVGVNGVKTPEVEKKVVEKKVEASKSVEVERAVVAPTEANPSQAEHVVIKKKSKCQCCVIQWFILFSDYYFDFWFSLTERETPSTITKWKMTRFYIFMS